MEISRPLLYLTAILLTNACSLAVLTPGASGTDGSDGSSRGLIATSAHLYTDGGSAAFDNGSAVLGGTNDATLTWHNDGTAAVSGLSGSAYAFTGPFAFKGGSYPGTGGTCGSSLDIGDSCAIVITFTGSTIGASTGQVAVNWTDTVAGAQTTTKQLSARVWWKNMSTVGAPTGRRMMAAAYTGETGVAFSKHKYLIWGGETSSGVVTNSGAIYDYDHDTWSPMASSGAPAGRAWNVDYFNQGVWTGNTGDPATEHRFVVLMGENRAGAVYNDGGVYDADSDSWVSTTTTGAPPAVSNAAVTWIGGANAQIFVWGGMFTNTGGIYSVKNDSWISTTTTGAPANRHQHSQVFTGATGNPATANKMIVWGGFVPAYTNTGGIYDIATDSWTAMTTTGAPSARRWHNAIWTGTTANPAIANKMVVWGGYDGSIINNGGIYDPATDSWVTIPAPTSSRARYDYQPSFDGVHLLLTSGAGGPGGIDALDLATLTWTNSGVFNGDPGLFRYQGVEWLPGGGYMMWGGAGGPVYSDFSSIGAIYLGPMP